MDEAKRERTVDDLKGFVKGELHFDAIARALYSTDASIFQVTPAGVVVPRDEADVQAVVRYAAENEVPLVARGAGTGVAGEALGSGLVLDLSRHFRQILEIGDDWVRVQPGVVHHELNARLAEVGRRFAPDPASGHVCTVGGMLANNASGAHALRHGYCRDHVLSLRAILDSGEAVTLAREPVQDSSGARPGHLQDILSALGLLLEQNAGLIREQRPRTPFNRCGYLLHDVLHESALDMPRLLVGSEGTLALFTEAVLRTLPLPGGRAMVLLGFASLEGALQAVHLTLPTGPAACELIDRRLLSLARGAESGNVAALIPAAVEAVLLVEYEADSKNAAGAAAKELGGLLERSGLSCLLRASAQAQEEIDRLWNLREMALPGLYAMKTGPQPVPFIEDVGVPVECLGEYLRKVQEIMQEHETTASYLVHAGTGQVHTRPFLDLARAEDGSRLMVIGEKVHALALDLGGTVSTQHGTGLARTPWVARQYGPLYPVFRQVKAIFDPKHLFNPGKIVDPDPRMPALPLRIFPTALAEPAHWLLRWEPGEVRKETMQCNGCGHCRLEEPGQRMCPIYRATHAEAATPRAKANLLRHLLQDGVESRGISSGEARAVADLCVNCKMCAVECPAHVNVPRLMLEAKAANVAEHGLDRSDWFLARIEGWSRWASRFSLLANLVLGSRPTRWLLEKMFGLSQKRRLPRFGFRHFLSLARKRGWARRNASPRPRVAYFADTFATYADPQLGEAAVAVLQHQGLEVHVPSGQRGSGAPALTVGDVESARDSAQSNVRLLAELVRDGHTIVCSEPTAALMLRQEYLDLLDDPEAKLVADNTVEITTFLADLHRERRLETDFQPLPMTVGHHVPCHLKALGTPAAGSTLLSLIPGLEALTIDVSCSGMAGTYGLKAVNYETSLAAGRPMLDALARQEIRYGASECSSCRLQIEEGAGKRALHPVQYLAIAYGLLPELARRLDAPIRDLVL
ncbi:MAG: FAD-binding protein [Planctomycetes bacterium]|nr:FAD-binding protein [Planctomycetota bacterium]